MGKGSKASAVPAVPAVKEPDPIAPVSPTAKGSEEVLMAGREEKERIRKSFSHSKTIFSQLDSGAKQTLG